MVCLCGLGRDRQVRVGHKRREEETAGRLDAELLQVAENEWPT